MLIYANGAYSLPPNIRYQQILTTSTLKSAKGLTTWIERGLARGASAFQIDYEAEGGEAAKELHQCRCGLAHKIRGLLPDINLDVYFPGREVNATNVARLNNQLDPSRKEPGVMRAHIRLNGEFMRASTQKFWRNEMGRMKLLRDSFPGMILGNVNSHYYHKDKPRYLEPMTGDEMAECLDTFAEVGFEGAVISTFGVLPKELERFGEVSWPDEPWANEVLKRAEPEAVK
jgi:hypothetical protein